MNTPQYFETMGTFVFSDALLTIALIALISPIIVSLIVTGLASLAVRIGYRKKYGMPLKKIHVNLPMFNIFISIACPLVNLVFVTEHILSFRKDVREAIDHPPYTYIQHIWSDFNDRVVYEQRYDPNWLRSRGLERFAEREEARQAEEARLAAEAEKSRLADKRKAVEEANRMRGKNDSAETDQQQ